MPQRNDNLNTRHGRQQARRQAQWNYDHGTPEYRAGIDSFRVWAGLISFVIITIVAALIYFTGGPDALKSWLK